MVATYRSPGIGQLRISQHLVGDCQTLFQERVHPFTSPLQKRQGHRPLGKEKRQTTFERRFLDPLQTSVISHAHLKLYLGCVCHWVQFYHYFELRRGVEMKHPGRIQTGQGHHKAFMPSILSILNQYERQYMVSV